MLLLIFIISLLFKSVLSVSTIPKLTCPLDFRNITIYRHHHEPDPLRLKLGISYDHVDDVNLSQFDYITIWLNTINRGLSTRLNRYYQGNMLKMCRKYNKLPLFYTYVVAFEARLIRNIQDCDVDAKYNLCHLGAQFVRDHRSHIVLKYWEHARKIAKIYGHSYPIAFVIEPDFWYQLNPITVNHSFF